ncbi:MAG: lycopene beta-cyclase CrtY [Planctomycetes bacterium]|nr:lycopene beta-cyclase CrtY [Planctomycetota bacterium]
MNPSLNSFEYLNRKECQRNDYILVGGGLQSGLMALAISHYQPNANWVLIEQQSSLAGNHTWSLHESDLTSDCAEWAEPLMEYRWPSYQIRVGGYVRNIEIPYRTCSSSHFSDIVTSAAQPPHRRILTNSTVVDIGPSGVMLGDGRRLDAAVVIDNRGPCSTPPSTFCGGFQKFWGFELELGKSWPHSNPIVMDDQIDQKDGFRFIYSLPMESRRVLVEDTRFSNTPSIDREECFENVRAYVHSKGCDSWSVIREEHGVLPMPILGALPGGGLPMLAGGYRGGWFHAATGYSMPMALRVAQTVATHPADEIRPALQRLSHEHAWRAKFARFLNRLLFELVKPETRYQIFRRFYRVLNETSIARFYGHRFTRVDAFRIVVGVPPMGLRPVNFAQSYWRLQTRLVGLQPSSQPLKVPG